MENPLAAAVFNNLQHLLENPDHVQPFLDRATADLDRNNALAFELVARLWEALRLLAQLRALPAPTEEEMIKYDEVDDALEALFATAESLLKEQLLLLRLVWLLLLVRAWTRARLLPFVLLAAVMAAVVLNVSTGGGVVPGLRSFVRFFILMLDFLFASNRPRHGG